MIRWGWRLDEGSPVGPELYKLGAWGRAKIGQADRSSYPPRNQGFGMKVSTSAILNII
jgi:hypothetical protein